LSDSTRYIVLLEKILSLLKNAKLEYLKASDEGNHAQDKRYLNLQSTLRNRCFQDIAQLLRSLNVAVNNLDTNRLNFEQIVVSSLKKTNHSHLHKCVEYDTKLLVLYNEALSIKPSLELENHRDRIIESISENTYFLEKAGIVLES
jgi:hypothetical protein